MRLSLLLLLTATADIASGFGRLPSEPVADLYTDHDEEAPPECAMHCEKMMDEMDEMVSSGDMCELLVNVNDCVSEACQDDPAALAKIDAELEPLIQVYCVDANYA
ncbi:hypothetical protein TeGR_g15315 [Tetraparma gracilis]|uniref:Extracellular membrane protein CFEM domain-containing protein n=1 Tax=Tetraparma gracilis TaxID=2962635 RepID=A0ABQ6MQE8_9STRA|nr:hypothetical protein TeGR_g15315 [Tetraparma gracilis]